MNFTTAYYLVLLYIAVMLKPLIPVVIDAYDHAFNESFHLATVHEKYGNNHLEKTLASSGSENENGKSQKSITTQEQLTVHINPEQVSYNFSAGSTEVAYKHAKSGSLSVIFLSRLFPPPKFS